MGIFDFLKPRAPNSASLAKERLRIIVAQERAQRDAPDYLPTLRREILEVLKKYVNVDPDAIQVKLSQEGGHELLELSVALPDKPGA
jgi:cell division topological specificity factor